MNPRVFLVLPVLALAWMLLVPETSFAQRRILRGRYYDASYDPYYGGSYDSYAPRRGLFGRRAARYGQPNGQMYGQPYMTSPMMSDSAKAAHVETSFRGAIPQGVCATRKVCRTVPDNKPRSNAREAGKRDALSRR